MPYLVADEEFIGPQRCGAEPLGICFTGGPGAGVDPARGAGFRVLGMHNANVGEHLLTGVRDPYDGDIVAVYGYFEGVLVAGSSIGLNIQHITEDEGGALFLDGAGKVAERFPYVGAIMLRLIFQDFTYDPQEMGAALCRRDEFLHAVAEQDAAHFVVVEDGAEGKRCGNFRNLLTLCLYRRSKKAAPGHVHHQYHGEFTLLLKHFHVGRAHTRRHVPVHGADVVSVAVLPYLAEGHTTPLEGRVVLSGKDLVAESLCPDLNLADLLYEFFRCH